MKIAVVGRPNTGKSTFINTLAQAERMIVSERPGTTRDSVDVHFELDGMPVPGHRHRRRQAQGQDPRQPRLLLDPPRRAVDPPRRRRPAVPRPHPGDHPARQATGRLHRPAAQAVHLHGQQVGPDGERSRATRRRGTWDGSPIWSSMRSASMSLHADGVHHGQDRQERQGAAESVAVLYKQAQQRVSTGTLNRVLREAVEAHRPPSRENRTPRIYYATQVDVAPPTIVLFVNSTQTVRPDLSALPAQRLPRETHLTTTSRSSSTCVLASRPRPERRDDGTRAG